MSGTLTRRQFSGGIVAASVAAAARRSALGAFPANEQVQLGLIGVGNSRTDMLDTMFMCQPDARFTGMCDLYEPYLEFTKNKVGGNPFTTKDYRRLLDARTSTRW